jgi:hypothetical protein
MLRPGFFKALHLLSAGLGIACAAGLFLAAADRVSAPGPRCLVLNTACWAAAAYAYNDPDAADPVVADKACLPSSLLNFVWCNEYEGTHQPVFENFGRAGGLDAHLISIYQALARPGVKTLLYINAPGALTNFMSSHDTLVAILVLEHVRREHPETAGDVETYLRYLYGSVGYQRALAELGKDWRKQVDSQTLQFISAGAAPETKAPPPGPTLGLTRRAFALYDWSFDRLSHLSLLRAPGPRLAPTFDRSERVLQLLDACARGYADPRNNKWVRRMMKKEDFWALCGGEEVWSAWVRLVATLCKARGIRFVYYVPTHVHVSSEEYWETFKPEFVDRVRESFAPYPHVTVIDHTAAGEFNAADLQWWNHHHGVPIKAGYVFNAVGRLKQARLLLPALIEAGVLYGEGAPARYLGSAWPGERLLPGGPATIPFVPEDKCRLVEELQLEPEQRIRSTQAVLPGVAGR